MKDYFSTLSMEELERQFEESKYYKVEPIDLPKQQGKSKKKTKKKKTIPEGKGDQDQTIECQAGDQKRGC